MAILNAIAVERGCGERQTGGVYAESALTTEGDGLPIEAFLMDPPVAVDAAALGLSSVGVKLLARPSGVVDVWDVVGATHYPNVADVVEEMRRFGMSRRLSTGVDFARLTAESKVILLHPRGVVENWSDLAEARTTPCPRLRAQQRMVATGRPLEVAQRYCPVPPTHDRAFLDHGTMCCGLWWDDVAGGEPYPDGPRRVGDATYSVTRKLPSFAYSATTVAPEVKRRYRTAIVAAMPIHRLAVIRDPAGGTHERSAELARKSALHVDLEDR